MDLHDAFAAWAEWLVPTIANHLWQATLFALLAAAAAALLGRAPARARTAVWIAAAAKFALPLALFAALGAAAGLDRSTPAAQPGEPAAASFAWTLVEPVAAAPGAPREPGGHDETFCVLAAVWAVGFAASLALWWSRHRRVARMVRTGRRLVGGREVELLDRACERLGVRTVVRVVESPEADEPGIWRVWHPVLVLPEGVGEHLNDAELEAVMMHEAAHVARRDNLVSNLQMALCCALWFHPVVWLIDRRLLAERERACDEAVIGAGGGAREYARGLLKVFRYSIGWRPAGVSCATGSHLGRRIEEIMNGTNRIALTWHRAVTVAVVVGLAGLSAAAMTFGIAEGQGEGKQQRFMMKRHSPDGDAKLLEAANAAPTLRNLQVQNSPAAPVALVGIEVKKVPVAALGEPGEQRIVRHHEAGPAAGGDGAPAARAEHAPMPRFPEADAEGNTYVLVITLNNTSAQTLEAIQIGGSADDKKFMFGFHRQIEPGATAQVALPVRNQTAETEGLAVTVKGAMFADGTTRGDFEMHGQRMQFKHPAH